MLSVKEQVSGREEPPQDTKIRKPSPREYPPKPVVERGEREGGGGGGGGGWGGREGGREVGR